MKIIHLIENMQVGGKERQLAELLNGLSRYKEIASYLIRIDPEIHYTQIYNLNLQTHCLGRKYKKDPSIFYKLYRLCKEIEPHIIHSWGSMPSIYALPITKLLRIKFINGMIRDASRLKILNKTRLRSRLRSIVTFPFSDAIVANSHAGLKSYAAPNKKSVCIHNSFDFNRIKHLEDKHTVKQKFQIDSKKIVGMVASFSQKKDYYTYISAANSILKRGYDVTFIAIGDGENLTRCKQLVIPQFQDKIKFLGRQKDVESIVNIFDIGILATDIRFHGEGISNSIMEYMALGKPAVATDSGGTKELVLNGITGFLVNPGVEKDLTIKIIRLLDNKDLANKMGSAAKERLYNNFSLKKMTNSYTLLYENILRERLG